MVRYIIISIVILCTGVSCNSESEDESFDIQTLEITNEVIKKEVINFLEEFEPPGRKESNFNPYITIKYLNADTVAYKIDYFGGPSFFNHHAIAFFVLIDEDYIPVEIEEMMHSSEFFFQIKR